MRRILLLTALVMCFGLTGCAAGIQGGVVDPTDEEAVPVPHDVLFVYDGARGTIEGVPWPDYFVSSVRFGDVTVRPITYPGWTVDRLDQMVVMQNEELRAVIMIVWVQYPELEVLRQSRQARAEGLEISDVTVGQDARHTSHFNFATPNDREGAMWGLYTDYRNRNSGALIYGHWPAEHTVTLAPQIERIAVNLVFSETPQPARPR